jgi:hypothetical protein
MSHRDGKVQSPRPPQLLKKVLVLSIATNGYDRHFEKYLRSQHRLAESMHASYCVVRGSPPWGISGHDSAWLKIPLLLRALSLGYEWVLFLDADCEVRKLRSPLEDASGAGGDVFMCHDFSRRINSGVVLLRNSGGARRLLRKLVISSLVPGFLLPKEDRNAYENGHVIHFWKHESGIKLLDDRWNWTMEEGEERAYIRHFGGWSARPQMPGEGRSFQKWRRRLSELFTAPKLILNGIYYARFVPRPDQASQPA